MNGGAPAIIVSVTTWVALLLAATALTSPASTRSERPPVGAGAAQAHAPTAPTADPAPSGATKAATGALRPKIIQRPIPFGATRRRDMVAYAKRHYGLRTAALKRKVIVQHFTANTSVDATYNTFAPNVRDPELRELPGTCAHFVIGTDGKIFQLVPLRLMCRHTVGLNHVAVGIEHVGFSDAQVMGNDRQRRASLRLSHWLRCRDEIALRDVIGHNENTSSRWHRERVERLRKQTHGDFAPATSRRYRRLLAERACPSV